LAVVKTHVFSQRPAAGESLFNRYYLSEYRSGALENTSDQGAWPEEEDFLAAFSALGYERIEE